MTLINDSNRIGDFAEYYAVTWLWDQGYEVFRNCGCTGPIDLIARDKDGRIILIDVKQATVSGASTEYRKTKGLNAAQKEAGVQLLLFDPHKRQCSFVEHRHETTYTRHRNQLST